VGLLINYPHVLVAYPGLPAKDAGAGSRSPRPSRASSTSPPAAAAQATISGVAFTHAGVDITHVPYRATARRSPISSPIACNSCSRRWDR
jgi:hypothetical protein